MTDLERVAEIRDETVSVARLFAKSEDSWPHALIWWISQRHVKNLDELCDIATRQAEEIERLITENAELRLELEAEQVGWTEARRRQKDARERLEGGGSDGT